MQKTKFALVSLLSLLVVFAPVSSVLAETEGASEPLKQEAQEEQEQPQSSVFEEIKNKGGNEVSNEKLDQKEGEGPLGAMIGAIGGGIIGLGTSLAHGITSNHGAARMARDVAVTTITTAAAGATIGGAVSGPA